MEIRKATRFIFYRREKSGFVQVNAITEYENLIPGTDIKVRKEIGRFSFIAEDESMVIEYIKTIIHNLRKTNEAFTAEVGDLIILYEKEKSAEVCRYLYCWCLVQIK